MKIQKSSSTLRIHFFLFLMACCFLTCDSGPKVIEAAPAAANMKSAPPSENAPARQAANAQERKIVVEEVLNTSKYSYLRASENDESFWVAISKRDIKVGETYYFKGGLLKKNFYSQEFDRVFETVYLVSNIRNSPGGAKAGSALDEALSKMNGQKEPGANLEVGKIERAEGAVKISELLANKEKYGNKLVKVTGKCVKVNPMIMKRNWVHLSDGSDGSAKIVITTAETVALGEVVTMEGTIILDKDFGAGYRYDIIMEGAVLK